MKRHLLFLPDVFLVVLIIFSCERVDLSDLRNSRNHFYMQENIAVSIPNESEIKEEVYDEIEDWKDYLVEYRDRAKNILSQIRLKVSEQ